MNHGKAVPPGVVLVPWAARRLVDEQRVQETGDAGESPKSGKPKGASGREAAATRSGRNGLSFGKPLRLSDAGFVWWSNSERGSDPVSAPFVGSDGFDLGGRETL